MFSLPMSHSLAQVLLTFNVAHASKVMDGYPSIMCSGNSRYELPPSSTSE